MKVAPQLLIACILAAGSACCQEAGARAEDVLLLLEVGVPSRTVESWLARAGGPLHVTEQDLEAAQLLGATPVLIDRLATRLEAARRVVELAGGYRMLEALEGRLRTLVPRDWEATVQPGADLAVIVLSPLPVAGEDWFRVPRVLLVVQDGIPLTEDAGEALGARLAARLWPCLSSDRTRPGPGVARGGVLAGGETSHHELSILDTQRGFQGLVGFRARVLPGGTLLLAAFACGSSDVQATRQAFEDVAEATELKPVSLGTARAGRR